MREHWGLRPHCWAIGSPESPLKIPRFWPASYSGYVYTARYTCKQFRLQSFRGKSLSRGDVLNEPGALDGAGSWPQGLRASGLI